MKSSRKSTRAFFSAASVRAAKSLLFRSASCCSLSVTSEVVRRKSVLLSKLGDSLFRIAKLLAEFDQAVAQPARGPFGRFESGVELIDHVGVSDSIGELRGSLRIGPGDGNIKSIGLPDSPDA